MVHNFLQEENEDMETEMRDNAEKLRKALEQSARLQSDYMAAQKQLNTLEKTKVCVCMCHCVYACFVCVCVCVCVCICAQRYSVQISRV